ncbi:MAG: hypothetical protein LBI69_03530 [Puniceicoccales bacterium]|jgi:hypothetical protein|nr:hypothetical protein [Puniceicoccales bacterium]
MNFPIVRVNSTQKREPHGGDFSSAGRHIPHTPGQIKSARDCLVSYGSAYPECYDFIIQRLDELGWDNDHIVEASAIIRKEIDSCVDEIRAARDQRKEMIHNPKTRAHIVPRNEHERRLIDTLNKTDAQRAEFEASSKLKAEEARKANEDELAELASMRKANEDAYASCMAEIRTRRLAIEETAKAREAEFAIMRKADEDAYANRMAELAIMSKADENKRAEIEASRKLKVEEMRKANENKLAEIEASSKLKVEEMRKANEVAHENEVAKIASMRKANENKLAELAIKRKANEDAHANRMAEIKTRGLAIEETAKAREVALANRMAEFAAEFAAELGALSKVEETQKAAHARKMVELRAKLESKKNVHECKLEESESPCSPAPRLVLESFKVEIVNQADMGQDLTTDEKTSKFIEKSRGRRRRHNMGCNMPVTIIASEANSEIAPLANEIASDQMNADRAEIEESEIIEVRSNSDEVLEKYKTDILAQIQAKADSAKKMQKENDQLKMGKEFEIEESGIIEVRSNSDEVLEKYKIDILAQIQAKADSAKKMQKENDQLEMDKEFGQANEMHKKKDQGGCSVT